MRMTGLTSVSALVVIGVLAGNLQLADVSIIQHVIPILVASLLSLRFQAKNWRYWSNVGCYEFSFERTVFFELTDAATPLSCDGCEGSELCKWCHNAIFIRIDSDHTLDLPWNFEDELIRLIFSFLSPSCHREHFPHPIAHHTGSDSALHSRLDQGIQY